MSVGRWLVALFALAVLAACGAQAADEPVPAEKSAQGRMSQTAAPAQSAASVKSPPAATAQEQAKAQEQARAFVERQPGTLGVMVLDRRTGVVWKAGNTTATTWTASTIKLAIAADLLVRQRQGVVKLDAGDRANLRRALVDSDNDAATALWERFDGAGMPARFRDVFGMRGLAVVAGYDVFWRHLRCSAEDLNALSVSCWRTWTPVTGRTSWTHCEASAGASGGGCGRPGRR